MTVARSIRNKAQTTKDRITEELGRVTRNRRLQRHGRNERVSGSLNRPSRRPRTP